MMTEKFIDLIGQITEKLDVRPGVGTMRFGVIETLAYLDHNLDQAPGRTITRSDCQKLMDDTSMPYGVGFTDGFHQAGGSIVDDPEPTNAEPERDRDWWVENANVNDAEDCEACEGDLCPVHYGISMGIDLMARKIAALGDDPELFALIPDPVKAPEGES